MNRRGFLKIAPAIICSKGLYRGATKLILPGDPEYDFTFGDPQECLQGSWQSKTAEEILADVNDAFINGIAATANVPRTMLLGQSQCRQK